MKNKDADMVVLVLFYLPFLWMGYVFSVNTGDNIVVDLLLFFFLGIPISFFVFRIVVLIFVMFWEFVFGNQSNNQMSEDALEKVQQIRKAARRKKAKIIASVLTGFAILGSMFNIVNGVYPATNLFSSFVVAPIIFFAIVYFGVTAFLWVWQSLFGSREEKTQAMIDAAVEKALQNRSADLTKLPDEETGSDNKTLDDVSLRLPPMDD